MTRQLEKWCLFFMRIRQSRALLSASGVYGSSMSRELPATLQSEYFPLPKHQQRPTPSISQRLQKEL